MPSLWGGKGRRFVIATATAVVVAATGTSLALGAAHHRAVQPDSTVFYQASTSGAVVEGENDGSGNAVEGVVGSTVGSIGMLGFATSTSNANVGMEGLAWGPSSVGLYGQGLVNSDTTHPTIGLLGTSTSGVGVEGQSLVANTAGVFGISSDGLTSGQMGTSGFAGVAGKLSDTGFLESAVDGEPGVAGTFAAGQFDLTGLLGGNASEYGVLTAGSVIGTLTETRDTGADSSHAGFGVEALDSGNSSFPDYNTGGVFSSTFGIGLVTQAGGTSPGFRPTGFSTAEWVVGGNTGTASSYAVGEEAEAKDSATDLLYMYNDADGRVMIGLPSDGHMLDGFASGGTFDFDAFGNLVMTGHLTDAGGTFSKVHGISGHDMTSYGARTTMPTLEDFGEGQLVAGQGQVRIDASLSDAIDHRTSYIVFITPEGDSRGLYVTNKTGSGFTVRENQGGRDSLAFSYRVVAKPIDQNGGRLAPFVANYAPRPRQLTMPHHAAPRALDAYQMLVSKVGAQRAQAIVAQFMKNMRQRDALLRRLPHTDTHGTLHLGSTPVRVPSPIPH